MKKLFLIALLLFGNLAEADTKISQLPLGNASTTGPNDSFPYVNSTAGTTERLDLSDLINLPSMSVVVRTNQSNTFTSGPQSLGTQVQTVQLQNDSVTGTSANKLAKLTTIGRAIITTTSDTSGVIGVVAAGAGLTGSADVAQVGQVPCIFDGATSAGDYVQISSMTAGDCTDGGSSLPSSGQVIGRVLTTNLIAGTYSVILFMPSVAGSGGAGGVSSVAMTVPSWLTVTGSPITGSGTLAVTGTSESQNLFLASPNGSSGAVTPRSIVAADIPTLNQNTTGSAGSLTQTLTSGLPIIGNGTGITTGTRSGNTTAYATTSGSLTSGDCLMADASGNVVTTGSACSSITTGDLTDAGTDGITVTGGTGAVVGSGTSLSQQVSDASHNGYLSSTDWGTFNTKQSTVSFAAVGSSPSADAGGISSGVITLQPFDGTHPGVVTASGGGTTNFLRADGSWAAAGGGTVTSVSVASTNGFAGTSSGGSTPALTLSTSITGPLKGDGTAISAAAASDIVGLFSTCSGTQYLGADGACHTPSSGFMNPMTTLGDMMSEDNTPTAVRVAGNTSTTLKVLNQTGTGSVSAAPIWTQPDFSWLSGNATAAQGGTGQTSLTSHSVIIGEGTSNVGFAGPSAFSGFPLLSNGSSSDPTFGVLGVDGGGTGIGTGSSGGIPYFSSTTTMGTSATLTANQIVLGGGAGTAPATLGSLGNSATVLHGNASGAPSFGSVALGSDVSGVLPPNNGGTGLNNSSATGIQTFAAGTGIVSSYTSAFINLWETVSTTLGDLVYGGASGTPTVLHGNSTAIAEVLTSQGTGSAATAPSWQPLSAIGISTDTAPYSPSYSSGWGTVSPSTNSAQYMRVADHLIVQGGVTTGTLGSGFGTIGFPGSLAMDATKIVPAAANTVSCAVVGGWKVNTGSNLVGSLLACTSSSTTVVYVSNSAIGGSSLTIPATNVSSPLDSSTYIGYWFSVPISGWSSNTIGVGQGSVLAAYGLTTQYTPSGGASVLYDTKISDAPTPNFNTSTGVFTSPVSGNINVQVCGTPNSANTDFYVVKNGSTGVPGGYLFNAVNGGASGACGGMTMPVNAGDTLAIKQDSAIALSGSSTDGYKNWVSFTLASGNGSGNVSSSSTGSYHIESATLNLSGATTVSISRQSGSWLSSVSASSNNITANITSGEFSTAPSCTITCNNSGANAAGMLGADPTTSALSIYCINISGASSTTASSVNVICMGPK